MALESATVIDELVATNPTAGDPVSQGDDHIRLIKSVLLASLVNNSTKAATGHIEFPDGTIINYGTATTNGSGVATLTFSKAFPTAQRFGVCAQGSGNYTFSVSYGTSSMTANMLVGNTGVAAGAGLAVYFLAIGY